MYQRTVLIPASVPYSSDQPVIGVCLGDEAADRALDGGVRLRDEGAVGLGLDDEVAAEVFERDRVGRVATGQGERQPRLVARGRLVRTVGHALILAPSGS